MARRGRPTVEIKLSGNERKTLERWARRLGRPSSWPCGAGSCWPVPRAGPTRTSPQS